MLTCRQLTEPITDDAEGRLSFIERLSFQLHLGLCGACRRYLDQVRLTVRILGRLPPSPPPEQVRQQQLSCFRTWQRERRRSADRCLAG